MDLMNESVISTIIGAVLGLIASVIGGWFANKNADQDRMQFAANVLYNDLVSIERYLKYEQSPVNLRYSDHWQNMVADCTFLSVTDLELIYKIYDEVYNFNYLYHSMEKNGEVHKEEVFSYKILTELMYDTSKGFPDFQTHTDKYEKLMRLLFKATGGKESIH